jgi:hypothetical protein
MVWFVDWSRQCSSVQFFDFCLAHLFNGRCSENAVDAIHSSIFISAAGVLVGAFVGFYVAKRIVERRRGKNS